MPEGEEKPWITQSIENGEWDACEKLLDSIHELMSSKIGRRVLSVA